MIKLRAAVVIIEDLKKCFRPLFEVQYDFLPILLASQPLHVSFEVGKSIFLTACKELQSSRTPRRQTSEKKSSAPGSRKPT